MPRASWMKKDERKYAAILRSCTKTRGRADCQRVAAATVNRDRGLGGARGCPHAQRFRELVNMTPAQIRAWAKNPKAKRYSLAATRARLPALAKLRAKPLAQWTARDCAFAARVVSFNSRMRGALARDGCTPGYAISLRNWGHAPKRCKP